MEPIRQCCRFAHPRSSGCAAPHRRAPLGEIPVLRGRRSGESDWSKQRVGAWSDPQQGVAAIRQPSVSACRRNAIDHVGPGH